MSLVGEGPLERHEVGQPDGPAQPVGHDLVAHGGLVHDLGALLAEPAPQAGVARHYDLATPFRAEAVYRGTVDIGLESGQPRAEAQGLEQRPLALEPPLRDILGRGFVVEELPEHLPQVRPLVFVQARGDRLVGHGDGLDHAHHEYAVPELKLVPVRQVAVVEHRLSFG